MTSVKHIVAFNMNEDASIPALTKAFIDLAPRCRLPSGAEYIKGVVSGGKQFGPEKRDHGVRVVYIVEFTSVEDLMYYVNQDPAHKDFIANIEPGLGVTDAIVFDYVEGEY